jgi:hypothetical protein
VRAAAADVTGTGGVSHADVMEVALAWQEGREQGDACGGGEQPADVNGDGCVDVADVQLTAAAAAGETAILPLEEQVTTPPRASESAPSLFVPFVVGQGAPATDGAVAASPPAPNVLSASTLGVAATATFTVNSTLDTNDIQIGDGVCLTGSGVCTLRAAIAEANAMTGTNTIVFNIPFTGVQTIQLGSRLPTLHDESGGTLIDGYSQPGSVANSAPAISNAKLLIELTGNGGELFDAFAITSAGNMIRGLAIYNFKRSLWIYGPGAHDNVIAGNFIGTDAAATFRATVTSTKQAHGVHVEQGAYANRIGGTKREDRNVVSGNARHGVGFWHVGTNENVVLNNLVGLTPDGQWHLANRGQGVDLNFGAARNIVGGLAAGERNVIAGNNENGIEISHTEETTENRVIGNYIGTDVTGNAGPPFAVNRERGIWIKDRVTNNLVTGNVIANNHLGGVLIDEFDNCCVTGNVLENNRIGIGVGGAAIPNSEYGVRVLAGQTRIGPGNIIAYNPVGIEIAGQVSFGNTITQNSIFANLGLGIDIDPLGQVNPNDPQDADSGPNQALNFPVLVTVTREVATGTACSGCRVEVFVADGRDTQHGQGKTLVGEAVADATGLFTATLDNVQFGHYLTATATDADGNTSEFSQNILVRESSNRLPQAVDDIWKTQAGTPIVIDVLANDTDPDGDTLFVVNAGSPGHGVATTNGTYVLYRPNVGFEGVDAFEYTISDDRSGTDTAVVTVTVEATAGPGQVIVSPTELTLVRGGDPESYAVRLVSAPTAVVTISLVVDGQIGTSVDELVFDAVNWSQPQTVTVTAGGTESAEAVASAEVRQHSIFHQVRSTDSAYDHLGVPSVTVFVAEPARGLLLPSILR